MQHLLNAFSFLTIIPAGDHKTRVRGRMFAWFPLVGAVIGGAAAAIALIPGLPDELLAILVLGVWVGLTGGLHLDGFADSCDALFAPVEPERRLEIMRDPQAGTWAVVGVVLLLLAKWAAILPLIETPALIILPPVLGRWAMVVAAWSFPHARKGGMGVSFGRGLELPQVGFATFSGALAAVILGTIFTPFVVIVVLIPPIVTYAVGRFAATRLGGGLTGDVYGAVCELSELLTLIGLLALLGTGLI